MSVADEDGSEVLEGFICPKCITDLKTAVELIAHFQENHSEEQDLLKSLKGIFGKAKKILNKETSTNKQYEGEVASVLPTKGTPGYQVSTTTEQDIGVTNSHTSYFKAVRNFRMERYAAQTNNLLIRLDKLLKNLPSDPLKRKAHEQDIVPWLDEKEVKLCPGCAKSFGLLRRKHHCRLCGAVMCNECTFLLSLDDARKMVDGMVDAGSSGSKSQQDEVRKLQKTNGAVQSVLSLDHANDSHFRLCQHCYDLLHVREKLIESRTQKPIICQFYDRLSTYIKEVDNLVNVYIKMWTSLSCGDTKYQLAEAQAIRVKLLKLAENIDSTSKKISVLGQNTDTPPHGVHLQLQQTIRNAATYFLKENVIGLPSLPTEEKIKEIQEQKRLEVARKIEMEQRRAQEKLTMSAMALRLSEKVPKSSSSPGRSVNKDPKIVVEEGWTPDICQPVQVQSDLPVIIEQINIIQGFIKQARCDHRYDEVATLEKNLRELKEEYYRQTRTADDGS